MRVVQIAQKPQRRGAEIFAFQLAQSLRKTGNQVKTLYLYPYYGADQGLPLLDGDEVLDGDEHNFREKVPGINPTLLRRLKSTLQEFNPDIVQVNGARTIKYGAFAKRDASVAWRCIYRNIDNPAYWIRDPFRKAFYRRLVIPQVDGIIGVSQATLDQVQALYKPKAPSVYIPNGIDLAPLRQAPDKHQARESLGAEPDSLIVLFVGNLTTQKRPDRFLRVVEKVRSQVPSLHAWILGDGPLRRELEDQASSLQLSSCVRFFGYQQEIAPYLAASDLLLVTSDSDGIPAAILEAGMLHSPTIAPRVGGIPECVLDGETGILVDEQDESALVDAVVSLAKDVDRRNELGRQASIMVESQFAMDVIAQRYLDFYARVRSRQDHAA